MADDLLGGGIHVFVGSATLGFDEFAVTYDMVREYADRDAYIWFFLLLLRNSGSLTPAYRLLPLVAVLAGFASYELVVKLLLASPP